MEPKLEVISITLIASVVASSIRVTFALLVKQAARTFVNALATVTFVQRYYKVVT